MFTWFKDVGCNAEETGWKEEVGCKSMKGSSRVRQMGCMGYVETSPGSQGFTLTSYNADEPGLSTSATVVVHFLKASPVPALTLASGPSRHLCTPRQDYGVVVSGVSEDPDLANRKGPYSFALGPNPTVQRDWRLQRLNGM